MKINKDFLKGFNSLFDAGFSMRAEADEHLEKMKSQTTMDRLAFSWHRIENSFAKAVNQVKTKHYAEETK